MELDTILNTVCSNKCISPHTHCGALWMANIKDLFLASFLQNEVHRGWNVILSHFIKATKQRQKVSCVRDQWGTAAQSFPAQISCVDIKKNFFYETEFWWLSFQFSPDHLWVSAHYTNLNTPLYCPYMCDNTCKQKRNNLSVHNVTG